MDKYKIIGLLGDSIANGYWDEEAGGWFNRLTVRLKRQKPKGYAFCNMAKGGDTSMDVWHRLLSEASGREIDTLIIAAGVNDIVQSEGAFQLSNLTRRMTWNRILGFAKQNFANVLVVGLLPVIDGELKPFGVYVYNKDVKEYNRQLEEWCQASKTAFYSPYEACGGWNAEMYEDNVHPNAVAHEIYAGLIYDELKKLNFI